MIKLLAPYYQHLKRKRFFYVAPNFDILTIDIDGTLIVDKDEISPANIEALRKATQAGVHVALCTGRAIGSARRFIEPLSLTENVHIFFDGAVVSRDHQVEPVFIESIPSDILLEMISRIESTDLYLELASIDRYFAREETWVTQTKREFFGMDTIIMPLDTVCMTEKIVRGDIVIRTPEEHEQANRFISEFSGRVEFSEAFSPAYGDLRFVNVISSGISKGKAVTALANHLGVELSRVMAVGDWLNDIPMLQTAGLGVAMGNAHEAVKQAADEVTLRVEDDGLAAAIEKYLL